MITSKIYSGECSVSVGYFFPLGGGLELFLMLLAITKMRSSTTYSYI